jgi:hypothetical protein
MEDVKRERSLSVQSRVDVVDLAEVMCYFNDEGVEIKTMSQLVSWSVALLREVLESNGKIVSRFESLAEAHNYLVVRGMFQASRYKGSVKKLSRGMRFESLRAEGVDPKEYVKSEWDKSHSRRCSSSFNGQVTSAVSDEDWETIQMRIKEAEAEEREALMKKEMESARNSGLVVSDDWISERQRKDREIRERENAPVDPSMFKVVEEP